MNDHSLEAYLRRRTTEELYQIWTLNAVQQDPDTIALIEGMLQEYKNTPAE